MRLADLAKTIDAELVGDPDIDITAAATLEAAGPGEIAFLANTKYVKQLETTKASAVVVHSRVVTDRVPTLKSKDPYYAFRQAVVALYGFRQHPFAGIHPKANVDPTATVGENTVIYPGAFVGQNTTVGRDCILYPNAVVYDGCIVGDRCIIHAGASIGQDGFGFATSGGVHHKIPQVGNAVIEDDVEIGSCAVIARAALGSTRIAKGTKVDAAVVIGHGTQIGPYSLLVAQVGIAGSVVTGHHVTMAGQVGVAGHIKIGDNVTIAAQGGVANSIDDNQIMFGAPAMPASHARRVYSIFANLPALLDRVKELEQAVDNLADSGDTPIA